MQAIKKYYQLIPEKVYKELPAIEDLLRSYIKGFSPDYLREIISIVACHIRKDEGSTPLKMTYIKKLVPQGDKYVLAGIELGIIQRSGFAKNGIGSYKYSFTSEYESKYLSLSLTNAKLIRRIESAQEGFRKDPLRSTRGRSEQTKYLRQLTLDEGYINFIDASYTTGTEQYNFILSSATRILNGDFFYTVDSTSGRFHSNVTNMARGLRPYLRVKGEPLVNIDIKNSQPYLSTILLTNPGKVLFLIENSDFALLLQTLKVSINEDVRKYVSLAVSGRLYEYLMAEFFKEGLTLTRDETKTQLLRILFARNRMPKDGINRQCRQIFKLSFPTVYRIFNKVRGHSKGDKFQNFKRFAILLQRIEAYLMLDVILKRIYRELPGVVAITIHDSIMTGILTNNVEAVRKIMIEEFTRFVGFAPKIKIEDNKEILRRIEGEEKTVIQYDATNPVSYN